MREGAKIAQTRDLRTQNRLAGLTQVAARHPVDHPIPRHRQRTEGMSFWTSLNAAVKNTLRNSTTRRRSAFAAFPLNRKRPRSLHRDLGLILS